MSKLKFDRLLNLKVESGEVTIVPKGELWRGRVYGVNSISAFNVNGESMSESNNSLSCVEGAVLSAYAGHTSSASVTLQGIAFKVVENV